MLNSYNSQSSLKINDKKYQFFNLQALDKKYDIGRLPYSLKILLENLLRLEDDISVTQRDIESLLKWDPKKISSAEIAFTPSRVILQDFTGVPVVVDLAAMREAMKALGGKAKQINPLSPVELVIDHSVMVDHYGKKQALQKNADLEFERNQERYGFLRWGQTAFDNFRVVPPDTGIVHQVNLEYLARVVFSSKSDPVLYPDTVVGTDSHTTMINGLGVLGWGVGGIEAEAAMLGQPATMLIPEVVGFKLSGEMPEGTTATDLVLTITEILRNKKVVGKFVEFFGDGLDNVPLADRATIANMAPEYGATCGIFPIDNETLNFLRLSGREEAHIKIVEEYAKAQGFFRTTGAREAEYSEVVHLNLETIEPSIAGPKRPQDRVPLKHCKKNFADVVLKDLKNPDEKVLCKIEGQDVNLTHGAVVIAAITSCTNTSNADVMIAAGLLAKKAHLLGLTVKPWVKTSLAPGSQVVTDYLDKAGLSEHLDALGFHTVGYGCTTCIGNSGPLLPAINEAIKKGDLSVSAALSGNRNFEGRIHPEVRNAYLCSPPLVVAFALAGTTYIDFYNDPIGQNTSGKDIYLKDIWPTRKEIQEVVRKTVTAAIFNKRYSEVFTGDARWQGLKISQSECYEWDAKSSYVQHPPYFENMSATPCPINNIMNAQVLALLGDSVTTDHISPAGDIAKNSPAGEYLQSLGVAPEDFNSYGARRGNHQVMVRGTFANIRLKNLLLPGIEGGVTLHHPTQKTMSIFDAATQYQKDKIPLVILAGKEYGTGSSRDWAAKGTLLLGVKAVITESFERIHRANLVGMGILPLEFMSGESIKEHKLTGAEHFSFDLTHLTPRGTLDVDVKTKAGELKKLKVRVRIDTPKEMEYYEHGGILQYVLRQLLKQ